jgi:hypothetical protein
MIHASIYAASAAGIDKNLAYQLVQSYGETQPAALHQAGKGSPIFVDPRYEKDFLKFINNPNNISKAREKISFFQGYTAGKKRAAGYGVLNNYPRDLTVQQVAQILPFRARPVDCADAVYNVAHLLVRKPDLIDQDWNVISESANALGLRTVSGLKWTKKRMKAHQKAIEEEIYQFCAAAIGESPKMHMNDSNVVPFVRPQVLAPVAVVTPVATPVAKPKAVDFSERHSAALNTLAQMIADNPSIFVGITNKNAIYRNIVAAADQLGLKAAKGGPWTHGNIKVLNKEIEARVSALMRANPNKVRVRLKAGV